MFFLRFDFISIPIVHPRYKREYLQDLPKRPGPLTRSDKVLSGSDWCSLVVAKLSPWIDLDSRDETVRRNSEKVSRGVRAQTGRWWSAQLPLSHFNVATTQASLSIKSAEMLPGMCPHWSVMVSSHHHSATSNHHSS